MAKREYLEACRRRYFSAAGRTEKSRLLDEFCATTRYDRKYVIRFLNRRPKKGRPKKRQGRGRKPLYGPEVLAPLKAIWRAGYYPCGKRLKPMLALWLPGYERLHGALDENVRKMLLTVSAATIDRMLRQPREKLRGRGRTTTKPGTLLRSQIPIQTAQWEETRPGYLEADTVAHCGGNASGCFAFTLDCVDIATGWTEQRALLGKTAAEVRKQLSSIEKNLPFPLLGFDSDNGSEFINETLVRHFLSRQEPVRFTRSRAYKKDDNAHVEQKNWTHVRQWIGYDRIEDAEGVRLLNEVYINEWRLYHNLYCSSVKLLSKQRIGSKLVKKHDKPKTPYQRVMDSPQVSDYAKRGLTEWLEKTNPFTLRKAIDTRLKKLAKHLRNEQRKEMPPQK